MWTEIPDHGGIRDVTAQNWMLGWMLICLLILLPVFPFILRWRRRRAQREAHQKVEKAKADILADGIVEGPKEPYVPHEKWEAPSQRATFKGPYGPPT